ncbi:MAG: hypothetical protein ACLT3W_03520 [Bifidobacterium pseudocatenulatum]
MKMRVILQADWNKRNNSGNPDPAIPAIRESQSRIEIDNRQSKGESMASENTSKWAIIPEPNSMTVGEGTVLLPYAGRRVGTNPFPRLAMLPDFPACASACCRHTFRDRH